MDRQRGIIEEHELRLVYLEQALRSKTLELVAAQASLHQELVKAAAAPMNEMTDEKLKELERKARLYDQKVSAVEWRVTMDKNQYTDEYADQVAAFMSEERITARKFKQIAMGILHMHLNIPDGRKLRVPSVVTSLHAHSRTYTHIDACARTYTHLHAHARAHARTYTHSHAYTYTHSRAHILTPIHTHTQGTAQTFKMLRVLKHKDAIKNLYIQARDAGFPFFSGTTDGGKKGREQVWHAPNETPSPPVAK